MLSAHATKVRFHILYIIKIHLVNSGALDAALYKLNLGNKT